MPMSAAEHALADADALRSLAQQLLGDDCIIFPVRHHSPACAWQLQRLMRQRRPSVVLVEGPRSFNALLPSLTDPGAHMPLAIYTYAVREASDEAATPSADSATDSHQREAAYYPFCDHSPELVALREAAALQVPARFIDLDFAEQSSFTRSNDSQAPQSLLDESALTGSTHLQLLAKRLGCRDHEELWEHLFEADTADVDVATHVARCAAYCQLARSQYTQTQLEADGTLAREAEMLWHISQAVQARRADDGPVLVVVGGFHAVALPAQLAAPPPRPSIATDKLEDSDAALIAYSQTQLDRLNGYASGMTSPAWHQAIWQGLQREGKRGSADAIKVRREVALAMLTQIADCLRTDHSQPISMPVLAAAYQQCLLLAQLRGRAAPLRDDVLDAVTSCFIKGDADSEGATALAVARRSLCGQGMGRTPPGIHTPPLLRDVRVRLQRQRIRVDHPLPKTYVLDGYRRPAHRITSRLLHALVLLEVPCATCVAGPDFVRGTSLERLQEHWQFHWSPVSEAALVEAAVLGSTLPQAAAQRFAERVQAMRSQGGDALGAAQLLTHACVLGLHEHIEPVQQMLALAIAADARFEAQVEAAAAIALLQSAREPLQAGALPALPALLNAAYQRAMLLGMALQGERCPADTLVPALVRLRELLAGQAGQALDASLYQRLLLQLQQQHDVPRVRGAACGLRYVAGGLDATALGQQVQGHFAGLTAPGAATGFLQGVLETAREAAWQQPALLQALDGCLQQWGEAEFITQLPTLRLAFSSMTPHETDRIAAHMAQLHGVAEIGKLLTHDTDADSVSTHLALSAQVRAALVADGLEHWFSA